jgi:hypothetical protein
MIYKMRVLIFTIFFYTGILNINAQSVSSISINPIFEGNLMTVDGFGRLNEILKKNNLYTIQNEFMSSGIELTFTNRKGNGGVELSYQRLNSYRYDSTDFTNKSIAPFVSGTNLRITFFKRIFNSKRWYANVALGLSTAYLNFKLVNRNIQGISFDTLLTNPGLLPTLDLRTKKSDFSINATSALYFRTKWFNDFDIGMKFGYSHPLVNVREWVVNGTLNNYVSDSPLIRLNNFYFQLSFLLKFNLRSISDAKELR